MFLFFFFKQKTAYEMRISDWSSDVCSSDLHPGVLPGRHGTAVVGARPAARGGCAGAAARLTAACEATGGAWPLPLIARPGRGIDDLPACRMICAATEQMGRSMENLEGLPVFVRAVREGSFSRSEEHTSELQSLMRISYAVFCLKKKNR